MAGQKQNRAKRYSVLISLSEEARVSIDSIADELRGLGLEQVEILALGGVIAGEATTGSLAKMRRLPAVQAIETEPVLRSL